MIIIVEYIKKAADRVRLVAFSFEGIFMGVIVSNKRYKESKCNGCIWATKVNNEKVFCMFRSCFKKVSDLK